EDRIRQAVTHIPAHDYQTWVNVGMAIHSWDATERGLALWDWWSRTCPDKYDEQQLQKKWSSFDADRPGGLTLATLFENAKRGGWAPPPSPRVTLDGKSSPAPAGDTDGRRPVLCTVSSVERQSIKWLWPGRIALGKASLLVGDPGVAKSHLTLWLAGKVSNAGLWPDCGQRAPLGQVIILSAEDDVADTIRPRLEATGGDLSRIHVFQAVQTGAADGRSTTRFFNLAADLDMLEEAIRQTPDVKLLIIDPISAYIGKGVDSHCNSDIRSLLAPLAELAARFSIAILCVSHLNKGARTKAMYRTTGSLAFVAAARAVWAVARDTDDPDRRLLLPIKNNLARDIDGLAYRLEPWPHDPNFARCVWEAEPISISAEEALSSEEGVQRGNREDAEAWLVEQLRDGPVSSTEIHRRVETSGLSWATVRRAKDHLGVVAKKSGFDGGWVWSLPDKLKRLGEAHVGGQEIAETFVNLPVAADQEYHEDAQLAGSEHLRHSCASSDPRSHKMLTPPTPNLSTLDHTEHLRQGVPPPQGGNKTCDVVEGTI
ncbi:AAA family ATPase, partial [Verrucomicrobiota bacterium]